MIFPSIVFFGTPEFAAQILEFLIDHRVVIQAIVTQPDRPKGRSLQLLPSAVKLCTQKKCPDVPIWQPEKCSDPTFLSHLADVKADLFVVVAFGQILPQKLLDIPPLGCINVHASLLPKYRGAAPIQRSILNGDRETGIAIQKMVKQLDAGDVIAAKKVPIHEDTTSGELTQALCDAAKPLLLDVIARFASGVPPATPQDVAHVTFAPKIEPEEGEIRWESSASVLHCKVRGMNPRPGAWCWINIQGEKKRLKIMRSKVVDRTGVPGTILSKDPLIVGCGEQALMILELQLEGKPRMQAADWLRGMKGTLEFHDIAY